mgnify:FL=1
MKIQENIPLAPYTTFKIGGPARFFCTALNEEDLLEAVNFAKKKDLPILVLGGGSNILVADAGFTGLVIKIELKGIVYKDLGHDTVIVFASAGEIWDYLVEETVMRGLYGLENLSSIPGTVGASPVQNIGAYGAEVSNSIESIRILDTKQMGIIELPSSNFHFTYRDSIFKREKGRYIIVSVNFKLSKKGKLNTDYRDIQEYFSQRNVSKPTISEVRKAIIEIRSKKLPDWKKWGTAGSYFKNPIIPLAQWQELEKKYPNMSYFVEPDGRIKVSLGWILDKLCDAKGLVMGNVGTYKNQALVVVAKAGATANEVITLTRELMKRVKEKTGIDIESEVEWVC